MGARKNAEASRALRGKRAGEARGAHSKDKRRKVATGVKQSRAKLATEEMAATAPDSDVQNLDKIAHIVVLMMENRSFDEMLGYLTKEKGRSEVNGLKDGMSNTYNGTPFPIYRETKTKLGSHQDPCHDGACVAEQLSNGNGGFVTNYAKTHQGDRDVGLVMGYFNATTLPTFDYLAEEFSICDQWYASVPGATWPNRLYAVAGRADGSKDNTSGIPQYKLPSFVRHLDQRGVSWKWYAYPLVNPFGGLLTTLQMTDDKYNPSDAGNYAYADPHFFADAANGQLASVSWIDPNFGYPMHGAYENDDHPPADVVAGQELVLKVYHAVTQGPLWKTSLLIIVYDEHGGFYDHVEPPAAKDDDPNFRTYGVRVPAFIVSPWVARRSVSSLSYDHTSIIKTILLRFCRTGNGIPDMGARVNNALHLGGLLSLSEPRLAPELASHQPVIDEIAGWHAANARSQFEESAVRGRPAPELTEFQKGLAKAAEQFAAREKRRAQAKKGGKSTSQGRTRRR